MGRQHIYIRDEYGDIPIREEDLPSTPGPEEELMAMEFQTALLDVQARMPADLKDIYELWATGEYSMEELARQFSVPIGTIRARVKRITRFLRRELEAIKETTHVEGVL